MNDASVHLYMQMLITLFAACLGLLVLLTMADADAGATAARALALLRLRRSRMNRMLTIRNIDRRLYVALTPLAEVKQELSNCRHCPNQQQCDAQLASGLANSHYAYCPNTPFLDTLVARIRRQKQLAGGHA